MNTILAQWNARRAILANLYTPLLSKGFERCRRFATTGRHTYAGSAVEAALGSASQWPDLAPFHEVCPKPVSGELTQEKKTSFPLTCPDELDALNRVAVNHIVMSRGLSFISASIDVTTFEAMQIATWKCVRGAT